MSVIFGTSGQGKQLARTTPIQVTGLKAVGENGGVALSIDPPSEASYAYLKDYWVTFKKASQGAILHPYDGEHMVFSKGQAPAGGQPLSALTVGSTLKITENSTPTQFLVLQHVYPNADSANTLLLRKEPAVTHRWGDGTTPWYGNSSINSYLENTYYLTLDSSVKDLIPEVSIVCQMQLGYVNTEPYLCKVFLLSATELGGQEVSKAVDGYPIPYFSDANSRKAFAGSSAATWWTRSGSDEYPQLPVAVNTDGNFIAETRNEPFYARPAFCLPNDVLVSEQPDADGDYTLLI